MKNKVYFFRQLATLIDSGVSLLGAIESMKNTSNWKTKSILNKIFPEISQGVSLSDSLKKFPGYFDDYVIQMIKAGETGGNLDKRLNNLADYFELIYRHKIQLYTRLLYPILLINAAFIIPPIVVIVTKGFVAYLKQAIFPLFLLYILVISISFLYKTFRNIPGVRDFTDLFFLNFPLFSWYFKTRAAYRFLLILGDLYEAGINQTTAVDAASKATGNCAAEKIFKKMIPDVQEGKPLVFCLKYTKMFPQEILDMTLSGDAAGRLPDMLKKSADFMGKKLTDMTNIATVTVPIFLYIFVAVYIGYVVISTFAQIYKPLQSIIPK